MNYPNLVETDRTAPIGILYKRKVERSGVKGIEVTKSHIQRYS